MKLRYQRLDVFTERPFGGNPLAVFPQAPELPDALMQTIARELNLSETVFVRPAREAAHSCALRIFTPAQELPFAGHPTIGTACALVALGLAPASGDEARLVFEEGVGPVPVRVRLRHGRPLSAQFTAARATELSAAPSAEALARVLGLAADDLALPSYAPAIASCGLPYLIVPLRDRAALARARLDAAAFARVLGGVSVNGLYLFCQQPELPGSQLRARMFAPELGIVEDPATGSAAAAFAGYLAEQEPRHDADLAWRIEQGFEMGRPSLIDVEVDKRGGRSAAPRVSGSAVLIGLGELDI